MEGLERRAMRMNDGMMDGVYGCGGAFMVHLDCFLEVMKAVLPDRSSMALALLGSALYWRDWLYKDGRTNQFGSDGLYRFVA